MDQYELIRTAHRVYGKSIRQIGRETGHHRETIRKALRGEEPKYRRRKALANPVMDPVAAIVEKWLLEDRKAPRRQRHTSRRIFQRLVGEHGFRGGESTVRAWVRRWKAAAGESDPGAAIPLDPEVAREAEVDWGTAEVEMGGERRTIKLFVMRSRFSGKPFIRAYPWERQEMFFDAHQHAFHYYGGVFPELVYDNLSVAVRKILRGKQRIEQERFVSFRSFYTFSARFCSPARGQEKGGVEGLIGFARRNFLVPILKVADFEELNALLLTRCIEYGRRRLPGREDNRTVEERFEVEQKRLLGLPSEAWVNEKTIGVGVDHYRTVRVDRNRYSVPPGWVGRRIWAHVGCWRITLYGANQKIATHDRLFSNSRWQLDPQHYLDLLRRRPGAFDSSRPIVQWKQSWPETYRQLLSQLRRRLGESRGTREFIDILKLHRKHPAATVEQAVGQVIGLQCAGFETIRHLVRQPEEPLGGFEPLPDELIPGITNRRVTATDLSGYGQLLGGDR
jgi:transposase